MLKYFSLLLSVLTQPAFAGCLSFADPPTGSACTKTSSELAWLNPPDSLDTVEASRRSSYDRLLHDPSFSTGVTVGGEIHFQLQASTPHLMEVFLMTTDHEKYSFVLEADGEVLDSRHRIAPSPGRLRPKRGLRHLSLLGIVKGGTALTVRSDSPRYTLSAVRWTSQKEFEQKLVPTWLERAGSLMADPFLERLRTGRRRSAEQLFDRLALSSREEVRREAVLGQTRVMYWLAAENHEPRDIERTAQLFRQALKLAPGDTILRQMISSSCSGFNIRVGRMPEGDFCDEVEPAPWPVAVPPSPPDAPEWAVSQRKLAARMDAITRWWVENRQQPNGEIGGGWGDDVEILRHWGPQALGLGSAIAARGLKNIADGLWSSGTLLNGYDRHISDVEHASEPTTDPQPLLGALTPDAPKTGLPPSPMAGGAFVDPGSTAANSTQSPSGRWMFT
jgi:hypothetical protein